MPMAERVRLSVNRAEEFRRRFSPKSIFKRAGVTTALASRLL